MQRRISLIVILAIVLFPLTLFAQQQQTASQSKSPTAETAATQQQAPTATAGDEQQQSTQEEQDTSGGAMMQRCDAMMAQADQVMEKIDKMQESLDGEVAAMNAAQGQNKIDAMAKVINTMVDQRKEIRQMLTKLHHGMMFHMMAHRDMCRMHHMGMRSGMKGMKMGPMVKKMERGMEVEAGNDMVVIIQK